MRRELDPALANEGQWESTCHPEVTPNANQTHPPKTKVLAAGLTTDKTTTLTLAIFTEGAEEFKRL